LCRVCLIIVYSRRIKAQQSDADAYVVELERRCGQEEVDSAVDRLEGQMQSEACKAVEMMHLDLASLRAKLAKVCIIPAPEPFSILFATLVAILAATLATFLAGARIRATSTVENAADAP